MTRLPSVCADCGAVYDRDDTAARCHVCQPVRTRRPVHLFKGSPESRGYDRAWRQLSRRARRLQPFCSDCGSPYDLTADHSPTAWERRDAGLPIRLQDVDVVCRRCNAERGPARGPEAVDRERPGLPDPWQEGDDDPARHPRGKAESQLLPPDMTPDQLKSAGDGIG